MPTQTNISSQNASIATIGKNIVQLDSIDSTNTHAMKQIQAKLAEHGTVYFALEQTAGKGQKGKKWQTNKGENILISAVINASQLGLHQQFYISAVAALATYDLLKKYIGKHVAIKWPNDIYVNDSKAAGILIENKLKGSKWQWCVVGIGVNINQTTFASSITNPTSLALETDKKYNVANLVKELCSFLETRFQQLLQQKPEKLLKEYNSHLYKRNKIVKLKQNNISFNCTIKEVNSNGQLLVENGLQEVFNFGEVQLVIQSKN